MVCTATIITVSNLYLLTTSQSKVRMSPTTMKFAHGLIRVKRNAFIMQL